MHSLGPGVFNNANLSLQVAMLADSTKEQVIAPYAR